MQSTKTKAPRQRKPRRKPVRGIRVMVPLNSEGNNGVLRITIDRHETLYLTHRIPSDFGEGFELNKLPDDGDWVEDGPVYHVNLDGERSSCDCKGHLQHGHCKHADGLRALKQHGKL